MLTENEITYLKTLMKKETERWEKKSVLTDLYRHAKYTIRKLTRQLANIDNSQLFRKTHVNPTRDNTLFMVYRAERLYEATSDAQKIFKFIAQHIYDTAQFEEVLAAK